MFSSRTILLPLLLLLPACSFLPASGPTERQVLESENTEANELGFRIVEVNRRTVDTLAATRSLAMAEFNQAARPIRVDAIGPGDTLGVSIFEVGSGLFSPGTQLQQQPQNGETNPGNVGGSTAIAATLPNVQVDSGGFITVPFVGRVRAAGRTPTELADAIRAGLKRVSNDPQVLVSLTSNLASTVIVAGDVKNPGRKQLTLNRERLLDMVAIAGGSAFPSQDTYVELTRNGRSGRVLLKQVEANPAENVPVQPGDRLQLIHQPRTFTVFGAAGKVSEIPLEAANVTLAEAVARTGGPSNERADPNAVFLFRYETPGVARQLVPLQRPSVLTANADAQAPLSPRPVIYRLDMMNPTSYFLAQRFDMRDKDLIYIANARSDRLSKFVNILYSFAFPVVVGAQSLR